MSLLRRNVLQDTAPLVRDFRCPLASDDSGRCALFELAVRAQPTPDGHAWEPFVTCRHLSVAGGDANRYPSRCLLGDAKSRRDHSA